MQASDQRAVQELLDRQAIADVLHRYCRGCDRADEAALRACFHPDSTHRHGGFEGASQDFVTLAMGIVSPLLACKHQLGNIVIAVDGDSACSECHYFAYQRMARADGTEEDFFTGGRYLDRFERRDGVWRIVRRVGLIDFERFMPPADRTLWQGPADRRGGKYPDDPLYREFPALVSR